MQDTATVFPNSASHMIHEFRPCRLFTGLIFGRVREYRRTGSRMGKFYPRFGVLLKGGRRGEVKVGRSGIEGR
jgi:hypothetical protein